MVSRIVTDSPDVGAVANGMSGAPARQNGPVVPPNGGPVAMPVGGPVPVPTFSAQTAPKAWSDEQAARYGISNEAFTGQQVWDSPKTFNGGIMQVPSNSLLDGLRPTAGTFDSKATIGSLLERLSSMSGPEITILQQKLFAAGMYGTMPEERIAWGHPDLPTVSAFGDLLGDATRDRSASDMPWQNYLDLRAKDAKAATEAAGPKTTTSRTVTNINATTAGAALRNLIGRNPTQSELDQFTASYNELAAKSPQVQTTTTDADGNQSTSTTGGVNPEEVARQAAGENPEYASYQAVATFMPALEKAMQADSGLGSGQAG